MGRRSLVVRVARFFDGAKRAHVQLYDLLVLAAAHQRRYIGKRVDIVDTFPEGSEGRVMAVAELLLVRPDLTAINPYYLLAVLRTPTVQELIVHLVRGQTGHLYPDDIGSLRVPVPESLDTQMDLAREVVGADRFVRRALVEAEVLQASVSRSIDNILYGDADIGQVGSSAGIPGVRESSVREFDQLRKAAVLVTREDFLRVAPVSRQRGRRRKAVTPELELDSGREDSLPLF
jgi:hypothetical protein